MIETLCESMEIPKEELNFDTDMADGCMKKTVCNMKFKSFYPDFKFMDLKEGLKKTYTWFLENKDNLRC